MIHEVVVNSVQFLLNMAMVACVRVDFRNADKTVRATVFLSGTEDPFHFALSEVELAKLILAWKRALGEEHI